MRPAQKAMLSATGVLSAVCLTGFGLSLTQGVELGASQNALLGLGLLFLATTGGLAFHWRARSGQSAVAAYDFAGAVAEGRLAAAGTVFMPDVPKEKESDADVHIMSSFVEPAPPASIDHDNSPMIPELPSQSMAPSFPPERVPIDDPFAGLDTSEIAQNVLDQITESFSPMDTGDLDRSAINLESASLEGIPLPPLTPNAAIDPFGASPTREISNDEISLLRSISGTKKTLNPDILDDPFSFLGDPEIGNLDDVDPLSLGATDISLGGGDPVALLEKTIVADEARHEEIIRMGEPLGRFGRKR